jgi:hypothetical protein
MSAESSVDGVVQALHDQLAALGDALVRGDVTALEASAATTGKLASTLRDVVATGAASPVSAHLLMDARSALLRCRRLGISLAALAGGPHADGDPTYLPTGGRSSVPTGPPSLEVSA